MREGLDAAESPSVDTWMDRSETERNKILDLRRAEIQPTTELI